jgi:hypothetical protein
VVGEPKDHKYDQIDVLQYTFTSDVWCEQIELDKVKLKSLKSKMQQLVEADGLDLDSIPIPPDGNVTEITPELLNYKRALMIQIMVEGYGSLLEYERTLCNTNYVTEWVAGRLSNLISDGLIRD